MKEPDLPGFVAELSFQSTEIGLTYAQNSNSFSIIPQDSDSACNRICNKAAAECFKKHGNDGTCDDFHMLCMCRCDPTKFCDFP
jgi:hypothetical protein